MAFWASNSEAYWTLSPHSRAFVTGQNANDARPPSGTGRRQRRPTSRFISSRISASEIGFLPKTDHARPARMSSHAPTG
jgi:hypothetical protein